MGDRRHLVVGAIAIIVLALIGGLAWRFGGGGSTKRLYVMTEVPGKGVDIGVAGGWGKPRPLCSTAASRARFAVAREGSVGGSIIAYVEDRGQPYSSTLHLMAPDCSDDRIITTSRGVIDSLAWSPDGQWLAYVAFEERAAPAQAQRRTLTGDTEIYVVSRAGGAPVAVAPDLGDDSFPAWSADGATIAFVSRRSGSPEVHLVPREGGAVTAVTHGANVRGSVAWMADGGLVFGRTLPFSPTQKTTAPVTAISVVHPPADAMQDLLGSAHPVVVAEQEDLELEGPVVSPNGEWIVFHGSHVGANANTTSYTWRVFVAKANGDAVHAVVRGQATCATFLSNGRIAAVVTARDPELYTFAPEGGSGDHLSSASSCPVEP